jgi:serine/threonine protein phosphatase PrpC
MSSSWAPLVHARTYEADFRILVAPEDFTDADIAWAKERIRLTTRYAEKLSDGPRWSIFRSHRHTFVGVTCQASDVSDDMNRDAVGRPLYLFLGLVTTSNKPSPCGLQLREFAELYSFVRTHWMDQQSMGTHDRVAYQSRVLSSVDLPARRSDAMLRPNSTEVFKDEPSTSLCLWHEAFVSARPVSICLGLSRLSDVDSAMLDGATVRSVVEQRVSLAKPIVASPEAEENAPQGAYEQVVCFIEGFLRSAWSVLANRNGRGDRDAVRNTERSHRAGPPAGWKAKEAELECPADQASRDNGMRDPVRVLKDQHGAGMSRRRQAESTAPISSSLQLQIVAFSDRGAVRTVNEDSVLVAERILDPASPQQAQEQKSTCENVAIAVADGMGGHAGGVVASRMVVESLKEALRSDYCDEGYLSSILREVNTQLFSAMEASPELMGMGSTVAGVLFRGDKALVFNVGDSRVYRVQDNLLQQLTTDDTRQPVSYGDSPDQTEERVTSITQALGGSTRFQQVYPHVREVQLHVGTMLLVCSDGLFDGVSLEALESAIRFDLDESVRRLSKAAMDAGGRDNISIVLVKVG